jgi:hypothetical protein
MPFLRRCPNLSLKIKEIFIIWLQKNGVTGALNGSGLRLKKEQHVGSSSTSEYIFAEYLSCQTGTVKPIA